MVPELHVLLDLAERDLRPGAKDIKLFLFVTDDMISLATFIPFLRFNLDLMVTLKGGYKSLKKIG